MDWSDDISAKNKLRNKNISQQIVREQPRKRTRTLVREQNKRKPDVEVTIFDLARDKNEKNARNWILNQFLFASAVPDFFQRFDRTEFLTHVLAHRQISVIALPNTCN